MPDLGSFYELFQVKLSAQNGYYLYPRVGRKIFVTPTSTHPIHSQYFFIKKAKEGEEWEFPTIFQRMATPCIQWSYTPEGEELYRSVQQFI